MVRGALAVRNANLSERLEAAAAIRTSNALAAIGVDLTGTAVRLRIASVGRASDGRAQNAASRTVASCRRRPCRANADGCCALSVRIAEAQRDGEAIPGPWIAANEIGRTAERTRSLTGLVATVSVGAEATVAFAVAAAGKSQRKASVVGAGRRTSVADIRPNGAHVDAA
jgi:hypothetical protein